MLGDGLLHGLRIDVVGGSLRSRSGVFPVETADVVIEVYAATARRSNLLLSADPAYAQAAEEATKAGHL